MIAASSVPVTASRTACPATSGSAIDAAGNGGTEASGGSARASAPVMSPTVARGHGEAFGTGTPKRVDTNFSVETWSKVSEHT